MDSDEEREHATAAATLAQRREEEDAEIEAVRKRLLQARLMEAPEGELEKLQDRQRGRIERHNSMRSVSTGRTGGGGAMNDLMDLRFDEEDDDDLLPPSIQPNVRSPAPSTVASGSRSAHTTAGSSTRGGGRTASGTLSDYSDYDAEEGEGAYDSSDSDAREIALAGKDASALGDVGVGAGKGKGMRRPQIGPDYDTASLHSFKRGSASGAAAEDGEEYDPFADPDDDEDEDEDDAGSYAERYGDEEDEEMERWRRTEAIGQATSRQAFAAV